jgi:putative ABC transport system substrate-binding protein
VIVTSGEQATAAAMNATSSIPIVATEFGVDPVKAGFVASLARPEGNLTGLVMLGDDLWPKRFELLKQIAPRVTRLAVLWNPANPGNLSCLGEIRQAAASTGVQSTAGRQRRQGARARFAAMTSSRPTRSFHAGTP